MIHFTLRGEHVTLGKLLKLTGTIGSGGEAKLYLTDIPVLVNGQPEQRRGRKLRVGDIIQTPDGDPVRIVGEDDECSDLDGGDV